jgi:hypothetical protein
MKIVDAELEAKLRELERHPMFWHFAMEAPIVEVRLSELTFGCDYRDDPNVVRLSKNAKELSLYLAAPDDCKPTVATVNGHKLVVDGNHRLQAAMLQGREMCAVALVELE